MQVQTKISTLWIVVMFNMAFADIIGFVYPGTLDQLATGVTTDGIVITPAFLLVAAVLVEVGIAMIFLSRILPRKANRIANFVAVVLTTLFIVGGGSLQMHYIFFAGIEIIAMLYIAKLAWGWREETS